MRTNKSWLTGLLMPSAAVIMLCSPFALASPRIPPVPDKKASLKTVCRMADDHVTLTGKPVVAKLPVPKTAKGETGPTIADVVRAMSGNQKLYLVMSDLRTNVQPGVTYSLYLNLPPNSCPTAAEKHYVGSVNFFEARISNDPAKAKKSERFVSFDVTTHLKSLAEAGKLADGLTITIVPDMTPQADATPWIGEIALKLQ